MTINLFISGLTHFKKLFSKWTIGYFSLLLLLVLELVSWVNATKVIKSEKNYIQISELNPAYFSFSNGTPFIPIGINMINPSGKFHDKPDSALIEIEDWMKQLSDNGGNYIRVWLSNSFWDIEDKQAGKYSEEKAKRIDQFIALARKYHLHIKMTLEHFRSLTLEENPQSWATKFIYHTSKGGPLDSIRQYLTTPEGRKLFLNKIDFYKKRYGADTLFFGWELWNEMNAMRGPEDSIFFAWNETMLKEVKIRFPENLVMQSFGSFDADRVRPLYKKMILLPGNEVAQVHRYLDPGAELKLCQAPMDVICSSAIDEIKSYHRNNPVLLAETGAVEARHSGPSKLYNLDTAGVLLHDILFAPFFSGSAGTGMSWHWESYVAKNKLWYHFKRFSEAVKDINPIVEKFIPSKSESDDLRIYQLKGEKTVLIWVRDKNNYWKSELEEGKIPVTLKDIHLELSNLSLDKYKGKIAIYDPWKNTWQKMEAIQNQIILPDFKRSLVIKLQLN
ncbi:MAG: hypothetical protein ABI761_03055 [Saprospiraceae bacterium]